MSTAHDDASAADLEVAADGLSIVRRGPRTTGDGVDTAPVRRLGGRQYIRVGAVLRDRYRLAELIGRGGMADVFRAVDERLGRQVAVKVFRPGTEGNADRQRFMAEVRTLAGLAHPHLVAIYDGGRDEAQPWCVMHYLDGGTLSSLAGHEVSIERVAAAGAQIADGLAYIHERGIVHRDVKPSNVLLDSEGAAYLSDFGVAQMVDATRMTATGTLLGTAAYLSPEQVRGHSATPAVDIYALALVLLEILTGEREFPGAPVESAIARLSRAPRIPENLGPAWHDLLAAMTAVDPGERPDAQTVAAWLRSLAGDSEACVPSLVPLPRASTAPGPSSAPNVPDTADLHLNTLRHGAHGTASPRISSVGPQIVHGFPARGWEDNADTERGLPRQAVHAVTVNPVRSVLMAASVAVTALAVWQLPAMMNRPVTVVPQSSTTDIADAAADAADGTPGTSGGALVAPSVEASAAAPETVVVGIEAGGSAAAPAPRRTRVVTADTTQPKRTTTASSATPSPSSTVAPTPTPTRSPTPSPTASQTAVPIPSSSPTTPSGTGSATSTPKPSSSTTTTPPATTSSSASTSTTTGGASSTTASTPAGAQTTA